MTFKEQVATDFETTFLNDGEFARICNWNGQPLKIVKSAVVNNEERTAEGIAIQKTKIVCNENDLEVPAITEEIMLDGKEWFVEDVQKEIGHLIISLYRKVA
jgi:hypothetical protein